MAKFYVVGITKYDSEDQTYDVILKLEGFESTTADVRIQISSDDLSTWISRIGKCSNEFEIVFS